MEAIKQPGESRGFEYDFSPQLGGAAITSIVSATSAPKGAGANMSEVAGARGIVGGAAYITWSGGADGESYLTTVRVMAGAAGPYELDGEIKVRDLSWIVPALPANPYLTAQEYVDRFGETETIRMTDEGATGTINAAVLGTAIADAVEETESYLRSAYTLPLAAVPLTVKRIVADLARANLFRLRPMPAISDAAAAARTLLKDYAAGRATLQLPIGEDEPERNANGLPAYGESLDAAVFNQDKLSGFMGGLDF